MFEFKYVRKPKNMTRIFCQRFKMTDLNNIKKKMVSYQYKGYYGPTSTKKKYKIGDPPNSITKNYLWKIEYPNGKKGRLLEHILEHNDINLLQSIVDIWLGNPKHIISERPALSFDIMLNLAYYMLHQNAPRKKNFTDAELKTISRLTSNQLVALLGTRYRGPKDYSSLLFAVLTGKSTPSPNIEDNIHRYEIVITFSPNIIDSLYNLTDYYPGRISKVPIIQYPPHIKISLMPESEMERIMLTVNNKNVDTMLDYYGMISPSTIKTQDEKIKYFIKEIRDYKKILDRPGDLVIHERQYPTGIGYVYNKNSNLLTSKELLHFYGEPERNWETRSQLKSLLDFEINVSHWTTKNSECINNFEQNENIILSYGRKYSYSCYNVRDLIKSFTYYGGVFKFRNPDYDPESPAVDKDGNLIPEDFPKHTIVSLISFVKSDDTMKKYVDFYELLDNLLEIEKVQTPLWLAHHSIDEFRNFSDSDINNIKIYFLWLFFYSMYMAEWSGPPDPLPAFDMNQNSYNLYESIGHRDDLFHLTSVGDYLRSTFPQHLLYWLDDLPAASYKIMETSAYLLPHKLKMYLDIVKVANYRSVYADIVFGTFYHWYKKLFLTNDINSLIGEQGADLTDIQLNIMYNLLDQYKDDKDKLELLEDRIDKLSNYPYYTTSFHQQNFRFHIAAPDYS